MSIALGFGMRPLDWYFEYKKDLSKDQIAKINQRVQDYMRSRDSKEEREKDEDHGMEMSGDFRIRAHAYHITAITVIDPIETLFIVNVKIRSVEGENDPALVCTATNGSEYILMMSEQLALKQRGGPLQSKPFGEWPPVDNQIFTWKSAN